MNSRTVLVLAAVAAAAVVTAQLTRPTSPARITTDKRGVAVFSDFLGKANTVTSIAVRDKDKSFTVVRNDKGFFEKDSGYPVKDEIFRELVAAVATMSFEEAKTADEKRYEDLGLADPAKVKTDKAGREVAYFDASGKELARLVVGNREANVGGARGGQYIRLAGDNRAWLVRGAANVPAPHTAWFEINLINLDKKALQSVDLSGGGLPTLNLESKDANSDLKLTNAIPAGRKENTTNTLRVAFMMDPISFDDVRKARGEVKPDARAAVAISRDGLKITIINVGELKDGWVRIEADALTQKAEKQAEDLRKKIDGFEFKLIDRYAEVLRWTMDDLTEAVKS